MQISWECTPPYLSTGISNLLQPAQAEVVLGQRSTYLASWAEPVVIVAIWRINREVVHGQIAVSGEAAPMLHVFSSYRQRTC